MQHLFRHRKMIALSTVIVTAMAVATVYFVRQVHAQIWQHSADLLLEYTQRQCSALRVPLSLTGSVDQGGASALLSKPPDRVRICLINALGEIVVASPAGIGGNLFDTFNDGKNEVTAVARFVQQVRRGNAGTGSLRFLGEDAMLSFAPVGAGTGLYLVALSPAGPVARQTGAILMKTALLFACLLPGCFLLAALCAHYAGRRRRLADAMRREQTLHCAQAAEALGRAKGNLLSSVSHDIRTPMNAIVGLSTLLARDAASPDKVREHALKLASASRYLLGLVNDVLDMSRIESGKTAICPASFDLSELVESVNTVLRPQMEAKQQRFVITVRDMHSDVLLGDKLRINQILFNLLSNATKYTPCGGHIELSFEGLECPEENRQRMRICVSDNGIGISPEYLSTIFNPFTRETTSATKGIQGTGLGMAITKELVDLMGGDIRVQSEPGAGSTFTFELTLGVAAQEPCRPFWQEHGIRRMLILCGDEDQLSAMLRAMEGTGVDVARAASMADAERRVCAAQQSERMPDLVLLGQAQDGSADTDAAARLRSLLPPETLILALTDGARVETPTCGISACMPGPFFASGLRKAVEKLRLCPQEGASGVKESRPLEGMRLLVAEDNQLNAEIITELLHMAGADCFVAPDGRQAVTRLTQAADASFDAVLMDVQMPVMNGYEAAKAIRESGVPEIQDVPIVAMTANAFAEDVREAKACGMNAHIAKPVELPVLINTILCLCGGEHASAG